ESRDGGICASFRTVGRMWKQSFKAKKDTFGYWSGTGLSRDQWLAALLGYLCSFKLPARGRENISARCRNPWDVLQFSIFCRNQRLAPSGGRTGIFCLLCLGISA